MDATSYGTLVPFDRDLRPSHLSDGGLGGIDRRYRRVERARRSPRGASGGERPRRASRGRSARRRRARDHGQACSGRARGRERRARARDRDRSVDGRDRGIVRRRASHHGATFDTRAPASSRARRSGRCPAGSSARSTRRGSSNASSALQRGILVDERRVADPRRAVPSFPRARPLAPCRLSGRG